MPEYLHRRLRIHARENNRTTSEAALIAIQRELDRCEWQKRLAQRPTTNLRIPAADLIVEERSSRTERLANYGQTGKMPCRKL